MTTVQLEWNGEEAKRLIDKAADQGGGIAALVLSTDIRLSMPGAGAAAIGTVGRRTLWKGSNPGEPPGVRTGRLRSSVDVSREAEADFRVGTAVDYAGHLEFGTSNMPARPFMRPKLTDKRTHRRMVDAFIARATAILGGAE